MLTHEILGDRSVVDRDRARTRRDALAGRLLTLASVVPLSFVVRRLLEAPEKLVVSIPDDAFYYLTLAVNFVDLGRWSFDHGVSATNGFHPLYAYLLLPLAASFGFSFSLVKAAIVVNALLFACTIVWMVEQLRRQAHCGALLAGLACVVGGQFLAFNLTTAVEGTVAVSVMLMLWSCLLLGLGSRRLVFVLGVLAPLARIELGATAWGLWVLSLVYTRARRASALDPQPALPTARYATAAGGSLLGMIAVMAHNQWAGGTLLQGSGLVKLALARREAAFQGLSSIGSMVLEAFSPLTFGRPMGTSTLIKLLGLMAVASGAFALIRWLYRAVPAHLRQQDCAHVHWPFTLVAAVSCTVCYLALYARGSAHDLWYLVAFTPPIWLLLSFVLRGVLETPRLASAASVALTLFIGGHLWRAHTTELRPVQQDIYRGGLALRQRLAPDERVGSFNAGLVGFMLKGRVVNLDGLVNADAAAAVMDGGVDCYMHQTGLQYLFDLASTFRPDSLQRFGLTAVVASGALVPEVIGPNFERLTLYRIDAARLARRCAAAGGPPQ